MEPLEAAVAVLTEEGGPLHWTVIQDRALRGGHLDPFTRPDVRKDLLAALAASARDPQGQVVKTDTGTYALRDLPEA